MRKLVFGSQSRKSLPFDIAGVTFFARPLTTREELPLADLGDRYDLGGNDLQDFQAFAREQADLLAGLLQDRAQGDPTPLITPEWVMNHLGGDSLPRLLTFLRTGERPAEPLQLTDWTEEPLVINDREFRTRRLNFREQLLAADVPEDESTRATTERAAASLAGLLEARAVDGQPVTGDWLIDTLTTAELSELITLLARGPEVDDPNAEPNLTLDAAADASATSGG